MTTASRLAAVTVLCCSTKEHNAALCLDQRAKLKNALSNCRFNALSAIVETWYWASQQCIVVNNELAIAWRIEDNATVHALIDSIMPNDLLCKGLSGPPPSAHRDSYWKLDSRLIGLHSTWIVRFSSAHDDTLAITSFIGPNSKSDVVADFTNRWLNGWPSVPNSLVIVEATQQETAAARTAGEILNPNTTRLYVRVNSAPFYLSGDKHVVDAWKAKFVTSPQPKPAAETDKVFATMNGQKLNDSASEPDLQKKAKIREAWKVFDSALIRLKVVLGEL